MRREPQRGRAASSFIRRRSTVASPLFSLRWYYVASRLPDEHARTPRRRRGAALQYRHGAAPARRAHQLPSLRVLLFTLNARIRRSQGVRSFQARSHAHRVPALSMGGHSRSNWATEARMIDTSQLSYRFLNPRHFDSRFKRHLSSAYDGWHRVWSDTLRELAGATCVFSDEFSRQDEIGALFPSKTNALDSAHFDGSICRHRVFSRTRTSASGLRLRVSGRSRKGYGCASAAILRSHRNGAVARRGVPVKVLLGLALRRFLESGADVMVGTCATTAG
jgi:hypothetical protein